MKICTLLLSLAGLVSAASGQIPGVVSLPYSRSPPQLQKRDKFVDLSVGATYTNYIVNITVGTPPQPITLSLDTGSSDTLLLTQESSFCITNAGLCPSVGYYNANKSSTYKYLNSNFSSNFGFSEHGQGSSASGDIATDTFEIAGVTLKDQQFEIAYGKPTIALSILGLGYAAGESQVFNNPPLPQYDNFPLSLAKQGETNLALFSLWKDGVNSYDGKVLFGGIDTAKYTGSLTTLDTQHRTGFPDIIAFEVLLNGVALSGDSAFPKGSKGSPQVVLDCGTAYSILPDDWVEPIHKQFNVTYFSANDTAYVDCALQSKPYTIDYTFESLTIKVPMSAMVSLRSLNPNICSFGLVPAKTRLSLLGDNFLSSAYTVFDLSNNQISLAPRQFSSKTEKIVAVPAGGVKAMGSSTTNPSSTGTDADTTETTDKSSASAVSFPAYLIGIALFNVFFLGSFF